MDPEIKINDRVRLINPSDETKKDCSLLRVGDEGSVVYILLSLDSKDGEWKHSRKPYYIDLGKPINGHNCDGRCEVGHGSSVEREEVEVL
jgi:hypothetical protein